MARLTQPTLTSTTSARIAITIRPSLTVTGDRARADTHAALGVRNFSNPQVVRPAVVMVGDSEFLPFAKAKEFPRP